MTFRVETITDEYEDAFGGFPGFSPCSLTNLINNLFIILGESQHVKKEMVHKTNKAVELQEMESPNVSYQYRRAVCLESVHHRVA